MWCPADPETQHSGMSAGFTANAGERDSMVVTLWCTGELGENTFQSYIKAITLI